MRKAHILILAFLLVLCAISTARTEQIAASPLNFRATGNKTEVRNLPYGATPKRDTFYTVRTTIFGCANDDNGIGFFGGIDLWQLKWGVAELGYHGGSTGTALGGIPGGTLATIRNPQTGRMVNVVFADVGGGYNYYQLDLHCGVAKAVGLKDTGTIQIAIHKQRIRLTPARIQRGYQNLGIIPKHCLRTMKPCPTITPSTS